MKNRRLNQDDWATIKPSGNQLVDLKAFNQPTGVSLSYLPFIVEG